MATCRIEPFSPEHVQLIPKLRYADWNAFRYLEDWRSAVVEFMATGKSNSLFVNDQLVIIANLKVAWNGVGEIWALTSPAAVRYPLAVCKISKSWLEQTIHELGLHRVQSKVIVGFKESHKWTQWLGLAPELYISQYGPLGEDYIQYARVI